VGVIKALYVTSSFPKDTMPIDVMVEHQLNTLAGPNVTLKAVVFDNQPPWVNMSSADGSYDMQHKGLLRLYGGLVSKKLPSVSVKAMDYAEIEDPEYLAPVFDVNFTDRHGVKFERMGLRQLYGTDRMGLQMLSNFFAMTNFLKECMRPEHDDVDLCLYFDPDMLMYKNKTGIVELATATFEREPERVVVSPPYGCWSKYKWQHRKFANGACPTTKAIVSSRHVIAHRKRLLAKMPMPLQLADIGKQFWEVSMTEAVGYNGRAQITCGQDFFIAHPPSRFQDTGKGLGQDQLQNSIMSLRGLLKEMVPRELCSDPTTCSPEVEATLGTRELVRRFEGGISAATKDSMYNKGCGCCADMMPSIERVHAGEAFFQPRGELESETFKSAVNDAAFEWVKKCMQ